MNIIRNIYEILLHSIDMTIMCGKVLFICEKQFLYIVYRHNFFKKIII